MSESDPLRLPIETLKLFTRLSNCLKRQDINTIGDVVRLTPTAFAAL